ncbi:Endonuclease/exonuclease/phosphatase [Penicillium cf. griseofulvum]|uniref:Endonuclease/exonuclease/phosphatase n=1 Tax=Penicillium cf. griseofulvum TaxID=2972120 RepID=A0A9W9MSA9_9EURO|nr:Endonuclease/exonuclease/phosphatase [Penicillium cf. griseofulvum]
MIFFSRARTNILSWVHETPLPSSDQAYPKFQSWHHFDPVQQWIPTRSNNTNEPAKSTSEGDPSDLVLLTWNIDATSSRTQERVTEIVTFITGLDPKVHVVFLQEVSRSALQQILNNDRIRGSWFSSERDDTSWGIHSCTFCYPSHFDRDALCCDIFAFSPREPEPSSTTRIRLVNVHLDSLPMNPSYRPRQISIISSLLYAAGRGLVAGDFNPVLKDDATLIEDSGLIDVWTSLHSEDPGYTWGVDGEQPFPPNRLDKVAVLGLSPYNIKTLKPKRLSNLDESESQQAGRTEEIPWSDHHALLCSFGLFAK